MVADIGDHAEVLDRLARALADPQRAAQRHPELRAAGQRLDGPSGQRSRKSWWVHTFAPPAPVFVVDAQHRADLVVLEARREDVGRAVAQRVGDEDDRAVVELAGAVDDVRRVERQRARVLRAGLDRLGRWSRASPARSSSRPHSSAVASGVDELHRLGLDPARGEELEQELGRDDVPAAVAAYVHDQAVRGSRPSSRATSSMNASMFWSSMWNV